ncbi:MAG: methylmalonyl Co-A mutase-associated GTPase MeaB [Rhodocyclaceae bacterium]|jgi:LAO/AO transport system kinase|nr:methylmalonyl Co-A mutase-associated GTPase MeaB [Rhodocyclaceae bacterium]MBK6554897.1 methylmalonyl Co-A mutase-associated GTPase MeaB [Rhodocyclaceae bacterium]MBK9309823.1 methylmalonyl Co-A mutase-associated GTPase MeaB [Rhodocyclaceae bacterium]MBK9953614.1 methylmalonyl Co-A mutase-associated GTPase MeaB [Rhodocyclaceae bacterium]
MADFPPTALLAEDRALADGVLGGARRALAKAITLVESFKPDHQQRAEALLDALLPQTGKSIRVGITGVPGVGKSTFIEALGMYLIEQGHRVAVLAVDPSSSVSGGSILGDKTRMEELSQHIEAFIRPSPSSGSLGGVAEKTREALLLCEAAGFDVIIVETVGVGQSETTVAGMTDCFVLLQLPNAGDDLQAIKKGVVELADIVVFNKADIDAVAAERAAAQMRAALAMLRPASANWQPPVLTASAKGEGRRAAMTDFWRTLLNYRDTLAASGELAAKRRRQSLDWMWTMIDAGLRRRFREHPAVHSALPSLARAVEAGATTPTAAAHKLLNLLNRFF